MVAIPQFDSVGEYALFVLAVTLTTLLLLIIGGIVKWFFFSHHKKNPTLRKKIWFFPVFIASIFAMGWITTEAQKLMFAYLQTNVATSIVGVVVAILIAWFLYDWAIWRTG